MLPETACASATIHPINEVLTSVEIVCDPSVNEEINFVEEELCSANGSNNIVEHSAEVSDMEHSVKVTTDQELNVEDPDQNDNIVCQEVLFQKSFNGVQIKVVTPQNKRFSTIWDDKLKFRLFRDYILETSDPFLSGITSGRLAALKKMCIELRDFPVEYGNGNFVWKQLASPFTMADKMWRQGFSSQCWKKKGNGQGDHSTGLFSFLLKFVDKNASKSELHSKADFILSEAAKEAAFSLKPYILAPKRHYNLAVNIKLKIYDLYDIMSVYMYKCFLHML